MARVGRPWSRRTWARSAGGGWPRPQPHVAKHEVDVGRHGAVQDPDGVQAPGAHPAGRTGRKGSFGATLLAAVMQVLALGAALGGMAADLQGQGGEGGCKG